MTPTQRAAMEQALEAFDGGSYEQLLAAAALRAALAEQPAEQEPVGYMNAGHVYELQQKRIPYGYVYPNSGAGSEVALYTAPQPTIPPGYKLVPVEPTPEMLKAAIMLTFPPCDDGAQPWQAGLRWGLTLEQVLPLWAAMLAAAPEAPQPAKRVPLTDEEIAAIVRYVSRGSAMRPMGKEPTSVRIARAIEAAHGIKGD